jgi:hypothetical protein
MILTKEEAELLLHVSTFDIYFDSQGGGYYDDYRCPACFEALEVALSKSDGQDLVHLKTCKLDVLRALKVKLEAFIKQN